MSRTDRTNVPTRGLVCGLLGVVLLGTVTNWMCCSSNPSAELNVGGEIMGTVTVAAKPLIGGRLELWPATGRNCVACELGPNGEFRLTDPPLGISKVVVKTSHLKGMSRPTSRAGAKRDSGSEGMVVPTNIGLGYVPIPNIYESVDSTDLTITVSAGRQRQDLNLSAKKWNFHDHSSYCCSSASCNAKEVMHHKAVA